jgi:hypothetical protein
MIAYLVYVETILYQVFGAEQEACVPNAASIFLHLHDFPPLHLLYLLAPTL